MGHQLVGTPDKQRNELRVPDDFEVSLFAAEPMVINPTCMNWDQQGRLWVACAPLYPHVKPGHRATDEIVVLEDTDNDGKADKRTVFAEGLLIPTAILPGDGGAYVGNSTELIHLMDTDGDGKADQKRIVMSGFGTEDTHHILHTPRWGQDGLMYFNQSIYIHTHAETPWGVRRLMAGGVWQYDPRSDRAEIVGRGLVNSWGHQMDDWGQSFLTDGAGGHGINYLFPGVAGPTAYGTRHIMTGMNPGQPKHCGLEIISGTHFPEKYRGLLVANDFRGHRTNSFRLTDNGSGYVSTQDVDFVGTDHHGTDRLGKGGGFRPIDLKMGPDGALYVADWSNIIIQHGEVDFRDHRRDHENGRIWRITAKGRPLVKIPKIAGAPVGALIANLNSPERWTVEASKRELIERGASVLPAVEKWGQALSGADAERLRLHALWLHVALGTPNKALLDKSLAAKEGRVRAAAVRTLRHWRGQVGDDLAMLSKLANDAHPRVRLEAIHALRDLKSAEAAAAVVKVLDHETDKFIDYALVLTLRELQPHWVGKTDFGGNIKHLSYAIQATGNVNALKPLVDAFESGNLPAANRGEVFGLIGRLGNNEHVGKLLALALTDKLPLGERTNLLNAVRDGVTKRKLKPQADLKPLADLVNHQDAKLSSAAIHLAGALRAGQAQANLQAVAMNGANRNGPAAITALGTMRAKAQLIELVTAAGDHNRRIAALAAIADFDPAEAARRCVPAFNNLPENANPAPFFDAMYRQQHGPTHLNNILQPKCIPAFVARIGVRQATTCGRDLAQHVRKLSEAGGLKPMKQQLTPEEMKAMVDRVNKEGKPQVGEMIYRRPALACVSCHAIGGAGPAIGPDMVSIGASAPVDYLIESLLNPNAKIKEGYHMTVATLKNGQVVSGGQVSDGGNELVIRDPAGKIHTIAKGDVANKVVSPTSMMPPGLTASLQPEEFIHLVSFLSKLGAHPKFKAPGARYLRSFEVVSSLPQEVAKLPDRQRYDAVATSDKVVWQPMTSLVNGDIPLDKATFPGGHRYLRFKIEAPADGAVAIHVNAPRGTDFWKDGKRMSMQRNRNIGRVETKLKKGTHTLVFAVGGTKQPHLTVRIVDPKHAKTIAKFAN
jgi:putative heme-binding domain-containing protein